MERLGLLIGMAAGGFYLYSKIQKQQTTSGDDGTTDLTGQGTDAFQHLDRVLAYRLLKEAHEEVEDFDALTDTDLEQLLTSINIDPSVLRTKVTPEQAEFLMNSAREAARLRVDITINTETRKQWNTIIRASEKQKVQQWASAQNIEIDTTYAARNNPYHSTIVWLNRQFEI